MNNPRHIAVKTLLRVQKENAFAAAVLESELASIKDSRDQALATELVLGVLRRKLWLDHQLNCVSQKGLSQLDPGIMNILRVGAYQIIFLERVPNRAAVSEAVNHTKKTNAPRLAGLVNALLRNLSRKEPKDITPPKPGSDSTVEEISTACSLPQWLISQMIEGRGVSTTLQMAQVFNEPSNRALRINRHVISISDVLDRLEGTGRKAPLLPWSVICKDRQKAKALESEGLAVNQDEGAGLVSLALDPKPNEHILDACAGRGGKTGTIAMMTNNESHIVAVDRKKSKLDRLVFELSKQRLSADTQAIDLTQPIEGPICGISLFDRVLVDAPCSGTGTIGRRPEIRWRLQPSDVTALHRIQEKILSHVAPLVKPNGRLVLATCSVLDKEHTGHVESFLKGHPEFALTAEPPLDWPSTVPWNGGTPFVDPGITRTDGYGILCFTRSDG